MHDEELNLLGKIEASKVNLEPPPIIFSPKITPAEQAQTVHQTQERVGFLRRWLGRRNQEAPLPSMVPEQSKLAKEETIRQFVFGPADDEQQPAWAQKKVTPAEINLRSLPVDFAAITELGHAINSIKTDEISTQDLAEIKVPTDVYPALPMVASVISHQRNPEIPVILPNGAEIKAMKPWLKHVSHFLSRFSPGIAQRFDRFAEKQGQNAVLQTGQKIDRLAKTIENIPNPKQQFLKEVCTLYIKLAQPTYEESFWSEKNEVKIEDKISTLVRVLQELKQYHEWPEDTPKWIGNWLNSRDFPLTLKLLPQLGVPPVATNSDIFGIAGAEMMKGIDVFLRQHGRSTLDILRQQGLHDLPPVPRAAEFDIFDPGSWGRGLGETFAADKIVRVEQHLPEVLNKALAAMPSDGPALANQIYLTAENVAILNKQGMSANELAQNIFTKTQA